MWVVMRGKRFKPLYEFLLGGNRHVNSLACSFRQVSDLETVEGIAFRGVFSLLANH